MYTQTYSVSEYKQFDFQNMALPPKKGTNEIVDFVEVSFCGWLKRAGSENSKNSETKFLRFLGDVFLVSRSRFS